MNRKRLIIFGLVMLVAIGLILVVIFRPKEQPSGSNEDSKVAHVEIGRDGFLPVSLTIKKGMIVEWENEDDIERILASNPHPAHTDLKELESPRLMEHQSYQFTFDKVGTFSYHDHLNPTINGTITVVE